MPPCNYDIENKKDREEMATIMASHIEDGAKNYAQFVHAAKDEFGSRLKPGQELAGNLVDMYKEAWDAYNRRLDSPFIAAVSKVPGARAIRRQVRKGSEIFRASTDGVLKVVAPQLRSEEAGRAGYKWREAAAKGAREFNVASAEVEQYQKIVQRMPKHEQENFVDAMEDGSNPGQATTELDTLSVLMKGRLQQLYEKATSYNRNAPEIFNENYFPNWWEIPKPPEGEKGLAQAGNTGRPLEGSKRFLKEKKFATNKDGREAGWEWPENATPIDFFLWKVNELNRFIAAHEVIQDLRDRGLEWTVNEADIPEGYKPLNDKISMVVSKDSEGEYKSGGLKRVYPAEVADLINNHLDPGIANNPLYRGYMLGSNLLNSMQLGMSAFHGMFVSLDSTASTLEVAMKSFVDGIQAAGHGDMERAKLSARQALQSSGMFLLGPILTAREGGKILREWNAPGSRPEYAPIVDMMIAAGGRGKIESVYKLGRIAAMRKAWRQAWTAETKGEMVKRFGASVANALPAVVEGMAIPIMEWYVPRLKMGVFAQMARSNLARLGRGEATGPEDEAFTAQAWRSYARDLYASRGQTFDDSVYTDADMLKFGETWKLNDPRAVSFVEGQKEGLQINAGVPTRAQIRAAMGKAWDSVEDRLGEMTYENRHWNQTFKQIAQGFFRAPGWQYGNIHAAEEAATDSAKFFNDLPRGGRRAEVTHEMLYPLALFITVGLVNSLIQALLTKHYTGNSEEPKDVTDILYPRTGQIDANGKPIRVMTGNYITKDWMPVLYPILEGRTRAGVNKGFEMAGHKTNPVISLAEQIKNNRTFMGQEILPSDLTGRSWSDRYGSATKTLIRENLTPFAFRGESGIKSQASTDMLSKTLPFFGVIPAPGNVSRSLAENVMMDLSEGKYGDAPKTEAEMTQARVRNELRLRMLRARTNPDASAAAQQEDLVEKDMEAAIDAGKLSVKDRVVIRKGFTKQLTVKLFEGLKPEEALGVFNVYMSPEEKIAVLPELRKKRAKISDLPLTETAKEMIRGRFDRAIDKADPGGRTVPDVEPQKEEEK